MANKIKEIKKFISGIFSSFSSSDIGDDAASFSENIDSVMKDGVLKGIPKHKKITNRLVKTDISVIVDNEDGTKDLIYNDFDTGRPGIIKDLYGQFALSGILGSSDAGFVPVDMVSSNDKVFFGNGKENESKILYRTKKVPFEDGDGSNEWRYDRSFCEGPKSSFTVDRLLYLDGNHRYGFGIRYDHSDIYFVDMQENTTGNETSNPDGGIYRTVPDLSSVAPTITLGDSDNAGLAKLSGAACDFCRADIHSDYLAGAQGAWDHAENAEDYVTSHNYWFLNQATGASSNTGAETISIQKATLSMSDSDDGSVTMIEGPYVCNFDDGPPAGAAPGSILETKNYLWISLWKPSGSKFGRTEPFIYSAKLTEIIPGQPIPFKNRSLEWDDIKHGSVDFNLGWFSDKLTEHYFYNATRSWSSLDGGDWLRGWEDDYNSDRDSKGGHTWAGILWTTSTKGFSIYRHCLIPAPDWVSGNYDDGGLPGGGTPATDEDFVGILSRAEGGIVNKHSAQQYKVPKNIGSDYWKLRPSTGTVEGANGPLGEFGKFLANVFGVIGGIIGTIIGAIGGIAQMDGAGTYISSLWHQSVNMYYNGLAFENGILYDCIIQTSSSHDPGARLNHLDGSRIKIRTLQLVNQGEKRLEFLDIKLFENRLIISAIDNQDDDGDLETMFLFFDIHQESMTNRYPSFYITDREQLIEDFSEYASDWEAFSGIGHDFDENFFPNEDGYWDGKDNLPSVYTQIHGDDCEVVQPFLPLVDHKTLVRDLSSAFIYFEGTHMQPDLEPSNGYYFDFSTASFWRYSDEINTESPRSVYLNNDTGARFPVGSAIFAINTAWANPWDGAKEFHYSRYPNCRTSALSGSSSEMYKRRSEQVTLISTSGPLNISKHPFKWSITSTSGNYLNYAGQTGIPSGVADEDGMIPLTQVTPYYDGVYPMSINFEPSITASHNEKQFALGAKEISMRVKGVDYTGDGIPDFHYSVAHGKELYRYKINYVYDGYQDSPLSRYFTEVNFFSDFAALGLTNNGTSGSEANIDIQAAALTVTINLHKPENINKRITHIRLWRSQIIKSNAGAEEHFQVPAAYTLVDTIEVDGRWGVTNESVKIYGDSSVDLGEIATFTVVDSGLVGPSYEAHTGMPESIRLSSINYKLSQELNGFMYIGECSHPSFENASRLIFRSKAHRYSMFDWTRDFVALPNNPTALSSFDGRVIAFDSNNMYVINPDGMYIEDTYEGSGCIGQHALARSETGLCFADHQSIFIWDGREVTQIGTPIVRSHKYGKKISWDLKSNDYPVYIKFEPERRSYCVFFAMEPQYGNTWYERAENFSPDNEIKRWYDFYNADNPEDRRYIFNPVMVSNYIEGTNYPMQTSEYSGMLIPWGCGWDKVTQRYIADSFSLFESVSPGIGQGNLFGNNPDISYVSILQHGDYPDLEEVFDDNQNWKPEDEWGYYCYMYNVDRKRWDLAKIPKYRGIFAGSDGEIYGSILGGEDWVIDFEEGSIADTYAISENTIYGGEANTPQWWVANGYIDNEEDFDDNPFSMIKINCNDMSQYNTPVDLGYSLIEENFFGSPDIYGVQNVRYQFTEERAAELNAKVWEFAGRMSERLSIDGGFPGNDTMIWAYQDSRIYSNSWSGWMFPPYDDTAQQLPLEVVADWGCLGQGTSEATWMLDPVDPNVQYTFEQVRNFFQLLNTMPSGHWWPDVVQGWNSESGDGEPGGQWSPGEHDASEGEGTGPSDDPDPTSFQGTRPTVGDSWVAANWTPDFELPEDPLNYYHHLHPGNIIGQDGASKQCYVGYDNCSFKASIGYYQAFTEHPESIFSIRQELNNGTLTETYTDVWNDFLVNGYPAWQNMVTAGTAGSEGDFNQAYNNINNWGVYLESLQNPNFSELEDYPFIRMPYSGNDWSNDAIHPVIHYYVNEGWDISQMEDGLAQYSQYTYGWDGTNFYDGTARQENYRTGLLQGQTFTGYSDWLDNHNSPMWYWNYHEFAYSNTFSKWDPHGILLLNMVDRGIFINHFAESYSDFYILDNESVNAAHKLRIYKTFQKEDYAEILIHWETYDEDNNGIGWDVERIGDVLASGTPVSFDPAIVPDSGFTLKRLWGGEKLKRFQWISKNFDLENQTVNKILSRIKLVYEGTPPKFRYMINNDGKWISPLISNLDIEDYCVNYKIPVEHKKAKSVKIKIISDSPFLGGSYDTEVDSFSIIYRTRGNV